MTLKDLKQGQSAVIDAVGGEGSLRQHFLDMGVIPGAEVTFVKLAPLGDPMQLQIHGYELTLRLDDASKIEVTPIASVKREMGHKWAVGMALWQCAVAYLITMAVYYICMLCGV